MSAKLHLYLIRHAKAFPKGADYSNDALRPLTAEGLQQAEQLQQALTRLGVAFDILLSSPWTRAIQTAQALKASSAEHFAVIPELADNNFPALLTALRCFEQEDAHIALVGHQPWLEQLASWLITGKSKTMRLNIKKASILKLSGALNAGKVKLHWLLPPVVAAAIAHLPADMPVMEILDGASLEDALEDVENFSYPDFQHENFSPKDFS